MTFVWFLYVFQKYFNKLRYDEYNLDGKIQKAQICGYFFRFIPIDSLNVLLYACNGSMYRWQKTRSREDRELYR